MWSKNVDIFDNFLNTAYRPIDGLASPGLFIHLTDFPSKLLIHKISTVFFCVRVFFFSNLPSIEPAYFYKYGSIDDKIERKNPETSSDSLFLMNK